MKKYKSIGKLLAVSFLTATIASACTEDAMDKINENPNNPLDAPAKVLNYGLRRKYCIQHCRRDFSLYSSVYIEHETGISNQLYRAEVRSGEPTTATYLQQCMDQRVLKYQECKNRYQEMRRRSFGKRKRSDGSDC